MQTKRQEKNDMVEIREREPVRDFKSMTVEELREEIFNLIIRLPKSEVIRCTRELIEEGVLE